MDEIFYEHKILPPILWNNNAEKYSIFSNIRFDLLAK